MPDSAALAAALLDEVHVAVVPGEAFAGPGHVRISFARPMAELEDGARRIAAFLSRPRGD
jgi:aspartate/methionine/tyrosine aminotransferase